MTTRPPPFPPVGLPFGAGVAVRSWPGIVASRKGAARMRFTIEVQGVQQIQRAVQLIHEVKGVTDVERS